MINFGAGFPGIKAYRCFVTYLTGNNSDVHTVVIMISTSFACSKNSAISASMNSFDIIWPLCQHVGQMKAAVEGGTYLSVSTSTIAVFLDVDFQELCSERFDLFTSSRSGIKASNDSTHSSCLRCRVQRAGRRRMDDQLTVAMALRPATPAPMTRTLHGGILLK